MWLFLIFFSDKKQKKKKEERERKKKEQEEMKELHKTQKSESDSMIYIFKFKYFIRINSLTINGYAPHEYITTYTCNIIIMICLMSTPLCLV